MAKLDRDYYVLKFTQEIGEYQDKTPGMKNNREVRRFGPPKVLLRSFQKVTGVSPKEDLDEIILKEHEVFVDDDKMWGKERDNLLSSHFTFFERFYQEELKDLYELPQPSNL